METIIVSIHKAVVRMKWMDMCKPLRNLLVHSGGLIDVGHYYSFPSLLLLPRICFPSPVSQHPPNRPSSKPYLSPFQLSPPSSDCHLSLTLRVATRSSPSLSAHTQILSPSQLNYCMILLSDPSTVLWFLLPLTLPLLPELISLKYSKLCSQILQWLFIINKYEDHNP